MSPSNPGPHSAQPWYSRLGADWWATIVAGAIAVLAVADVLPRIPW